MQRPAAVQQLLLAAKQLIQPLEISITQPTRSMAFVVNVNRNNVDKAYAQLKNHFRQQGMADELRSREYRKTTAELKFAAKRAAYNKRAGVLILDRLKWVVKRRKLKT